LILGVASVLGAARCQPPPDCTPTGMTVARDVRYTVSPGVAARHQSLDVYRPTRPAACAASPLVVWVHGGGFVGGDKGNNIADKANLFTGAGWVFASINYRLVGAAGSGPTEGKYPAAEQDVAAAIAYLVQHATEYDIDVRNVRLLGHSAGAFLVSLVATDGSFLEGAGLGLASVSCAASLDTNYDIPKIMEGGGQNAAVYQNAFGNDPAVWVQASPQHQVAADESIPAFHIVTRGGTERVAQSQAFGETLRDAGVTATVQRAVGMTHEEVNDAVGKAGDTTITPPLMDFYRACPPTVATLDAPSGV
jgi:acetyl esterase/lipase